MYNTYKFTRSYLQSFRSNKQGFVGVLVIQILVAYSLPFAIPSSELRCFYLCLNPSRYLYAHYVYTSLELRTQYPLRGYNRDRVSPFVMLWDASPGINKQNDLTWGMWHEGEFQQTVMIMSLGDINELGVTISLCVWELGVNNDSLETKMQEQDSKS